ncbi:MAG: diacylglycerol kinase family protein [Gemmataceae bacterium]
MTTSRHYLAILNPRGGRCRGLRVLDQVRTQFAAAGVGLEVRTTEYAGHALEIARSVSLDGYAAVCVIGGDGTVHEVINGLLRRDHPVSLPLGLIPAGTGNTLHEHVGCSDLESATRCILRGATRGLDIAQVTFAEERVFCANIVGWGAVTDINLLAERLRWLGRVRYTVAALWHILKPIPRRAQLTLDHITLDEEYLFAIACNTRTTGSGMMLAPEALLDDGRFDVVLVRPRGRRELLNLFRRVSDGSHLKLPGVECHSVGSFGISTATPDLLNLDGEIKGVTPFTARVLPRALRVLSADGEA